jgi:Raf kinase inhibitor-like YbhB/YbcL family protein
MKIDCPVLLSDNFLPSQYSCDGEGFNPPLKFIDVPAEAKSLALIMEDPDAPAGTYAHWLLWNIHPSVQEIEENSVPLGAVEGYNDSGAAGYAPPCPPNGTHRYIFRLYALDQNLNLEPDIVKDRLEAECRAHLIQDAELITHYERG